MVIVPGLNHRLGRYAFRLAVADVLKKPPVSLVNGAGLTVLSQLQHRDLMMYLVAIQSLARFIAIENVVVLDDGTLTAKDSSMLKDRVEGIQLRSINDFNDPRCPSGGTWERLLAIAKFSKKSYVIQLDSDVLTVTNPCEVRNLVEEQTSFTIGTWDGQEIEPMEECSTRVLNERKPTPNDHVQMVAEATFRDLPDCHRLRYVRGCSGFAGFAKGGVDSDFLVSFSSEMSDRIGNKWLEWGSEQVMSNVIVANAPQSGVLPHPTYSDCRKMTSANKLIHFIGDCRFRDNVYARLAKEVIGSLA